jgi:hypothetical protein
MAQNRSESRWFRAVLGFFRPRTKDAKTRANAKFAAVVWHNPDTRQCSAGSCCRTVGQRRLPTANRICDQARLPKIRSGYSTASGERTTAPDAFVSPAFASGSGTHSIAALRSGTSQSP